MFIRAFLGGSKFKPLTTLIITKKMKKLSKEEVILIKKMIFSYWEENNRSHIDNISEWELTLKLVEKL